MFRVLEKATKGHGYEIIECYLSGEKTGMFYCAKDVGINDTKLRAKKNDVCEHKVGTEWFIADEDQIKSLIKEFNEAREKKGWTPMEFKRVNEVMDALKEGG